MTKFRQLKIDKNNLTSQLKGVYSDAPAQSKRPLDSTLDQSTVGPNSSLIYSIGGPEMSTINVGTQSIHQPYAGLSRFQLS